MVWGHINVHTHTHAAERGKGIRFVSAAFGRDGDVYLKYIEIFAS